MHNEPEQILQGLRKQIKRPSQIYIIKNEG